MMIIAACLSHSSATFFFLPPPLAVMHLTRQFSSRRERQARGAMRPWHGVAAPDWYEERKMPEHLSDLDELCVLGGVDAQSS